MVVSARCYTQRLGAHRCLDCTYGGHPAQHAALLVLAENVACHDPSCNHAVQIEWGQHGHPGSYRRRRVCHRWYQPRLCCDKHVPTLKAAEMAGYGEPIFDGYHSYHCVGEQLKKIGMQGEAASEVSWLDFGRARWLINRR